MILYDGCAMISQGHTMISQGHAMISQGPHQNIKQYTCTALTIECNQYILRARMPTFGFSIHHGCINGELQFFCMLHPFWKMMLQTKKAILKKLKLCMQERFLNNGWNPSRVRIVLRWSDRIVLIGWVVFWEVTCQHAKTCQTLMVLQTMCWLLGWQAILQRWYSFPLLDQFPLFSGWTNTEGVQT